MAEIVLGSAGEHMLKVCNGNVVAFSRIIEVLVAKVTIGEITDIIKDLDLEGE